MTYPCWHQTLRGLLLAGTKRLLIDGWYNGAAAHCWREILRGLLLAGTKRLLIDGWYNGAAAHCWREILRGLLLAGTKRLLIDGWDTGDGAPSCVCCFPAAVLPSYCLAPARLVGIVYII